MLGSEIIGNEPMMEDNGLFTLEKGRRLSREITEWSRPNEDEIARNQEKEDKNPGGYKNKERINLEKEKFVIAKSDLSRLSHINGCILPSSKGRRALEDLFRRFEP